MSLFARAATHTLDPALSLLACGAVFHMLSKEATDQVSPQRVKPCCTTNWIQHLSLIPIPWCGKDEDQFFCWSHRWVLLFGSSLCENAPNTAVTPTLLFLDSRGCRHLWWLQANDQHCLGQVLMNPQNWLLHRNHTNFHCDWKHTFGFRVALLGSQLFVFKTRDTKALMKKMWSFLESWWKTELTKLLKKEIKEKKLKSLSVIFTSPPWRQARVASCAVVVARFPTHVSLHGSVSFFFGANFVENVVSKKQKIQTFARNKIMVIVLSSSIFFKQFVKHSVVLSISDRNPQKNQEFKLSLPSPANQNEF